MLFNSVIFTHVFMQVGYCYCWTPGQNGWTQKANMLTRRQSHAMFTYDGKIYVMGGYTAGDLEDLSLGESQFWIHGSVLLV